MKILRTYQLLSKPESPLLEGAEGATRRDWSTPP